MKTPEVVKKFSHKLSQSNVELRSFLGYIPIKTIGATALLLCSVLNSPNANNDFNGSHMKLPQETIVYTGTPTQALEQTIDGLKVANRSK